MKSPQRTAAAVAMAIVAATFTTVSTAQVADAKGVWKNCTTVNHRYPHGVGRRGAHDHTTGDPVTNFKRSNRLYRIAMNHNRGLDRDHDKIACEKH